MADEQHPEHQMIEIGDLTEEPTAPAGEGHEVPARVVIEYRDRGVPWMLIPPLLALAAVLAAVGTSALKPEDRPIAAHGPVVDANQEPAAPTPAAATAPTPVPTAPISSPAPETLPPPVAVAEAVAAPEAVPPVVAAPAPFPRVAGVGFDPDALKADAIKEAPLDPAVAVAGERRVIDPPAAADEAKPQPTEVNPDVLPPDPRLARKRQIERIAELKRKVEADRVVFHAELAAILRKQGDRSAMAIRELCETHGKDVDPVIRQRVAKVLGIYGYGAGANRSSRIAILRAEGFPEPAILSDIFDVDSRHLIDPKQPEKGISTAVRGGPRSVQEVYVAAARTLLNYPPQKAARPATARSSTDAANLRPSLSPGFPPER